MANKSDMAYEFLRKGIITTRIEPDIPLRIQSLGKETGFGSTPVREALCRLEAEQLVVSAANCGFRSAPISVEQLKDLEQSRLVVETARLKTSIRTGDDKWESEIIAAHYQLAKLDLPVDTLDHEAQQSWSLKHNGFHEALLSAGNSRWLASFHKQITEQLDRHYHYTLEGPLRSRFEKDEKLKAHLRQALGIDHHTALMDATLGRDIDLAVKLLEEHVRFARDIFVEIFS